MTFHLSCNCLTPAILQLGPLLSIGGFRPLTTTPGERHPVPELESPPDLEQRPAAGLTFCFSLCTELWVCSTLRMLGPHVLTRGGAAKPACDCGQACSLGGIQALEGPGHSPARTSRTPCLLILDAHMKE